MNNQLSQKISHLYSSNKLPWIIICVGIVLRLARYLYNPSLWFDESADAIDIMRPFTELFYPSQDTKQTTILGFTVLIKLATQIFGNSEYALRLIPLLSGIISLFLFYKIANFYLKPKAVPIALGLFAISNWPVYLSSELKPYSSDVTIALLLYLLAIYIRSKKLTGYRIVLFGIIGAVAVWFSHPSVFILAGIGTALAISCFIRKERANIWRLSISYLFWALSFLALYFLYTRNLIASLGDAEATSIFYHFYLVETKAFMPLPPMSLKDFYWFIDAFFRTFDNPAGLTLTGIAALAFLVGCISIFSEKKENFFLLLLPVFFNLLASGLQIFPFGGVMVTYLVPSILLLIGEGAEHIREKTSHNSAMIGIVFTGLLFLHPLVWAGYHVLKPESRQEIKPALNYIKENWQDGDLLYVHYMSDYKFEYYTKYHPKPYSFKENDYIIATAPRRWYTNWRKEQYSEEIPDNIYDVYLGDIKKLHGHNRVWLVFPMNVGQKDFLLHNLDKIGKRLDSFGGYAGIEAVHLYDLSKKASETE